MSAAFSATKNGLPFEVGAFDLDGTVLRRNLRITGKTVAALQSLRERGMRLVVATGTALRGRARVRGEARLRRRGPGDLLRRFNGPQDERQETLLHRTLPTNLGVEVLEWAASGTCTPASSSTGGSSPPPTPRGPRAPEAIRRARRLRRRFPCGLAARRRRGANQARDRGLPRRHRGPGSRRHRSAFAGRLFVTRSLPHYVEIGGLEGTKSKALRVPRATGGG